MMKPLLRYLLLAFFVFPLGAQPPAVPPNVLREGLKHHPADTSRATLLLDLAQFYQCKPGENEQDLDSALLLARQAVALSRLLGFRRGEGKGYLLLAKALREKGAVHQGKRQAGLAMAIAQKHGYGHLLGHVYSELTRYYSNAGGTLPPRSASANQNYPTC